MNEAIMRDFIERLAFGFNSSSRIVAENFWSMAEGQIDGNFYSWNLGYSFAIEYYLEILVNSLEGVSLEWGFEEHTCEYGNSCQQVHYRIVNVAFEK